VKDLTIIIITGYSGSGKSTALAAFEDAGFYCVDNLPVELLPKFLELPMERSAEISGLAFVMDLREKTFLSKYQSVFESIREKGHTFEILFLEAEVEILLQRYSQTRRQHPLAQDRSLLESIQMEQTRLKDMRKAADKIFDTSHYNVHVLKARMVDLARKRLASTRMTINILSFGFKFGIPNDADLVVDVRFLANPYFVPDLKDLTGEDEPVETYVVENSVTRTFLQRYFDLLDFLVPLYEKEGKKYLTIAVGCTGGRHRSVAIARSILAHIDNPERRVSVLHRDIEQ
jgi:RNase adapter protein RapZ